MQNAPMKRRKHDRPPSAYSALKQLGGRWAGVGPKLPQALGSSRPDGPPGGRGRRRCDPAAADGEGLTGAPRAAAPTRVEARRSLRSASQGTPRSGCSGVGAPASPRTARSGKSGEAAAGGAGASAGAAGDASGAAASPDEERAEAPSAPSVSDVIEVDEVVLSGASGGHRGGFVTRLLFGVTHVRRARPAGKGSDPARGGRSRAAYRARHLRSRAGLSCRPTVTRRRVRARPAARVGWHGT